MLDQAFEALKTFDWGTDLAVVAPIDDAITASYGQAAARQDLETRLLAALQSAISRDAKDYVCRKLAVVGTAAAVKVLTPLLTKPDHAHMARYALERIPAPEATQALIGALASATGLQKVGIISSLGSRGSSDAVAPLSALLTDGDAAVARAAALALGSIGSAKAVASLQTALQSSSSPQQAIIDALLSTAEALVATHKAADARSIYQALASDKQSRVVRLAATRGLLACASVTG